MTDDIFGAATTTTLTGYTPPSRPHQTRPAAVVVQEEAPEDHSSISDMQAAVDQRNAPVAAAAYAGGFGAAAPVVATPVATSSDEPVAPPQATDPASLASVKSFAFNFGGGANAAPVPPTPAPTPTSIEPAPVSVLPVVPPVEEAPAAEQSAPITVAPAPTFTPPPPAAHQPAGASTVPSFASFATAFQSPAAAQTDTAEPPATAEPAPVPAPVTIPTFSAATSEPAAAFVPAEPAPAATEPAILPTPEQALSPATPEPKAPEAKLAEVYNVLGGDAKAKFGAATYAELTPEQQANFMETLAVAREFAAGLPEQLKEQITLSQRRADALSKTLDAVNQIRADDRVSGEDRIESAALSVLVQGTQAGDQKSAAELQIGGFDILRKLSATLPHDYEPAKALVEGGLELLDTKLVEPISPSAQTALANHQQAGALGVTAQIAQANFHQQAASHTARIEQQRQPDDRNTGQYL